MHRRAFTLATLALGLALAAIEPACFRPPSDDVLFSCEPMGDDRCPDGYSCEADGCCHRNGSDVEANFGACALGGNEGGTATDSGTEGETGDTSTG